MPSKRIAPAILPGGSGISRRIDIAVTDLPQPVSPTIATVSPALDVERHALDRAHHAVGRAEMRLQVVDLEQRHDAAYSRFARRGSSASRSPSPSRFTASTVTERNIAGKNTM